MDEGTKLLNECQGFWELLQGKIEFRCHEFNLGELRKQKDWSVWENHPGVYYFLENDNVVYIGRALAGTGLGARVHVQINAFGDHKWDRVIRNDEIIVGVICLDKDKWYIASALEVYLIDKLKPEFNKRIQ